MLGGSSAVNGMIYTRGNPADYNYWASRGNIGYDYDSVLPYFKKSEGNQYLPFVLKDNGYYHNAYGPVKISFFSSNDGSEDIRQMFLSAAAEMGEDIIDDINANKSLGFLTMQATVAGGRRQSAAKSYILPALCRKNLRVIKHAYVTKILIDKNNNAYGVKFYYKGKKMKAFARKEVILSAGVFQSPQLLMLSGVGPKNHLKKFNICVKTDIPVGHNLVDHASIYIFFRFNARAQNPFQDLYNTYEYALHGDGALNSRGATNVNGFINLNDENGVPQFQFQAMYYRMNTSSLKGFMDKQNYKNSIKRALLCENEKYDIAAVVVSNLHPTSRGFVKLTSSSPFKKPYVNPMYLSTEQDVKLSIIAMKNQLAYENTAAYRQRGGQFIHIPIEECDQYEFKSDDYCRCYIHYFGSTNNHHIGTGKMGAIDDPESVVDPQLRVKNIGNLRWVDSGV